MEALSKIASLKCLAQAEKVLLERNFEERSKLLPFLVAQIRAKGQMVTQ